MASFGLQIFLSFLLGTSATHAAPVLDARQSFTTLTPDEIAAFKPFSFYASAAYCQPTQILTWSCGANCDANPTFKPTASGGDGSLVQFWYVGFDPTLKTVIVGHQGTVPTKVIPLVTDLDFKLTELDPTLFPGISSSIQVHDGFAEEHAKTATSILSAVQTTLQTNGVNDVTLVGHSLGAALTLLDAVYLPMNLPGVRFTTFGYGLPRVGNQAFADYVDANVTLSHVNNKEDLIPILPGRSEGYHHPQGEKHIQDSGAWIACPGQDNTDDRCSTGDVSNIFVGDIGDHDGPYDGVTMGC